MIIDRWYDLLSVQDPIHDILEKGLEAREAELEIWIGRDGETKYQYTGDECRNGNRSFAAKILDIDGVIGD